MKRITSQSTLKRRFGTLPFLMRLPVGLLLVTQAWGIGFRIPNQDAEAIARGNAFAATADNPSAIYYNPAGITQLPGQNFQLGVLNYLGINTHYEGPAGDSDTSFEVIPLPQVYYTYSSPEHPLSLGMGLYAPFGLGVSWPEDTGFRSIALDSKIKYVTLNPVIAWRIHPTLSVAMGPTINYSEVLFTRGLTTATDDFRYKGDAFSFGFNAGILWQPHPQWSFGANYRAGSTMDYEGYTRYNAGAGSVSAKTSASLPFPQIASGGVSYRPTTNWNIEVNVDWTDWESLNTVMLDGSRAIFGVDLPLQLDWNPSWFYEFGITRFFDQGWFVSAGYYFCTETASSDKFTPAVPDTDLHVGSLGFGKRGDRWHWAIAAQLIAGPERSVSDSPSNPFTGQSGNGTYQLFIPTVSMSVRYKF